METNAEIHGALPGVVWMVLALPPHLSGVGGEDLVGRERAVLLRIPLLRDIRVLGGQAVGRTQLHAVAVGTGAMTVGAIITGGEIVMRGVVRTCPPVQFAGSVGYIFGGESLILLVVPVLCDFGKLGCERVCYGHFSSQTVETGN